jgi:hypothetical protein
LRVRSALVVVAVVAASASALTASNALAGGRGSLPARADRLFGGAGSDPF